MTFQMIILSASLQSQEHPFRCTLSIIPPAPASFRIIPFYALGRISVDYAQTHTQNSKQTPCAMLPKLPYLGSICNLSRRFFKRVPMAAQNFIVFDVTRGEARPVEPACLSLISNTTRSDIMSTYAEAGRVTQGSEAVLHCPQRTNADSEIKKQEWLQEYSHRLLGQWLQWRTPLGVACAYAERIKAELAEFYEDPLKRTFIEATYGSQVSHDRAFL